MKGEHFEAGSLTRPSLGGKESQRGKQKVNYYLKISLLEGGRKKINEKKIFK
jgi:hypothetical protein